MVNDFLNDEIQESLGEFRVEIGLERQVFETCDLLRFARGIGRGKVMLGLETADRLGVFEPLAQRVDEDGIEPVDAFTMFLEHLGGAGHGVSQGRNLSV